MFTCHVIFDYFVIFTYVESVLALLKNATCLAPEEAVYYTDELVSNVASLDSGNDIHAFFPLANKRDYLAIQRSFLPMFSISVISIIDDEASVDSTSVEICIDNHLPKVHSYDHPSN